MQIFEFGPWVVYDPQTGADSDPSRVGKWMYFWQDRDLVQELCRKAVEQGLVLSAKHNNAEDGVACFYGHIDDMDYHRKIIEFFVENDMIRRTAKGALYNISFKLDDQTRAGLYGSDFNGALKLSSFVNLSTGEWLS